MLLVEAEDCREEFRELLFKPLTGKQVAHGTQSRHHGKPELKGQQTPPCLLPALSYVYGCQGIYAATMARG